MFWNKYVAAYTNRLQNKVMTYFLDTDRLNARTKFKFQRFKELVEN